MFPHTVTVYKVWEDADTLEMRYNLTVLKGVLLDISKGSNVEKSGLVDADSATLYIPFSVKAVDAMTGEDKQYLPPKEFNRAEDKSKYWTLDTGGESSSSSNFFIKGEQSEQLSFGMARNKYDFVFDISTVDTKDFGTADMQHWQVGGK